MPTLEIKDLTIQVNEMALVTIHSWNAPKQQERTKELTNIILDYYLQIGSNFTIQFTFKTP